MFFYSLRVNDITYFDYQVECCNLDQHQIIYHDDLKYDTFFEE